MKTGKKSQDDETALRDEINRQLDHPLSDREWAYLERHDYVADALSELEDAGSLEVFVEEGSLSTHAQMSAAVIVEIRDLFAPSEVEMRSASASSETDEAQKSLRHVGARLRIRLHGQTRRDEILTDCYATLAGRDESVLLFRERALDGRLLRLEEVGAWLEERAYEEILPDYWLNDVRVDMRHFSLLSAAEEGRWELFPHDEHGALQPVPLTVWFNPGILGDEVKHHEVSCRVQDPATGWRGEKRVPVADGGILDELRGRAKHLSGLYGWTETDAATFLLTGVAPWVSSAPYRGIEFLPYVTRITLKLDPDLSPDEVAEIYHQCRDQIARGTRMRRLAEKSLRLAQFVLHRPANEPWEERRRAWNEEHPEWAYTQLNPDSFTRQAQAAIEFLLRPPYLARMPFDEDTIAGKQLAREEEEWRQEEEQERQSIDVREDSDDYP